MINKTIAACLLGIYCAATLNSALAAPQLRTDTPSGYPVPRFVALKGERTNCRVGPSRKHPIRYTFHKKGAPVLVIAETVDHWRRIRDVEGDECWAHKSVLRAPKHVFSIREIALFSGRHSSAHIRGRIAPNVLIRAEKQKDGWVRVSTDRFRGWTRQENLWGLPDSALSAAED